MRAASAAATTALFGGSLDLANGLLANPNGRVLRLKPELTIDVCPVAGVVGGAGVLDRLFEVGGVLTSV